MSGVKLAATYHSYQSNEQSIDYGDEINLSAAYAFAKHANVLLKYANYQADDYATDTDKVWLMLTYKY